jgi:hypothetical protein
VTFISQLQADTIAALTEMIDRYTSVRLLTVHSRLFCAAVCCFSRLSGRETAVWKDASLSGASFVEEDCFSIVSDTAEWNLCSLVASSPALNVVADFLIGIQALLQSGGKDLDVGEEVLAGPSALAPVASGEHNSFTTFPASPTSAELLRPDSTLDFILSTMSNKAFAADSQLHSVGVSLLHKAASALEATPESMADLISVGVAKQVVESMLAFPRLENMQVRRGKRGRQQTL